MSARLSGIGAGWRPELALPLEERIDLSFVEVIAENLPDPGNLPHPLLKLAARGVTVIPHGVSLGPGGADLPDQRRVEHLGRLAERLGAPLVSEHISFVRAGGVEAGHLLPIPRTRLQLEILCENVAFIQRLLPVPLALENIAALADWSDGEMTEAEFIHGLVRETGCLLLLDLSNLHANAWNRGGSPVADLATFPLDRVAYVHVGGGRLVDGLWHDTHGDPVPGPVFELVETFAALGDPPGIMLERDENFPPAAELHRELDALSAARARGLAVRG